MLRSTLSFLLLLSSSTAWGDGLPELNQACNGGQAHACTRAGLAYSTGSGAILDPSRAAALFRLACNNADLDGCYHLGVARLAGRGVEGDRGEAARLFRRACDGGYPAACSALVKLASPQFDTELIQKILAQLTAGCDRHEVSWCLELGHVYADGVPGVTPDSGRAFAIFQQACERGSAAGCNRLGALFMRGMAAPKSERRAAALFRRACDGGSLEGCFNLGELYASGRGVGVDEPRAVALYTRACDGGVGEACGNLGLMLANARGVARDELRATELYRRACDSGVSPSCGNLGVMYAKGRGVSADVDSALALFQRACNGGSADGCYNLACMYIRAGQRPPVEKSAPPTASLGQLLAAH